MAQETGPKPEVQQVEGFQMAQPETTPVGTEPLHPSEMIRLPAKHNPVLQQLLARVNADEDLHTLWRCQNINAVDRLGMSDHGPIHMQIVVNISLRILRMLMASGLVPSVVKNHRLTNEDAEVVVVLASLLHDVGMSIDRVNHEEMGLFITHQKAMELLDGIYPTVQKRVIVSEVLHAVLNHRSDGRPLTLEAGAVRLGDALDMAKGRSRIVFEAGQMNIHSVSAAAVDSVVIEEGETKPIRITVHMLNAAGLFQLDELLKKKLKNSGLEPYVEVFADVLGEADKRLFETYQI
ncbi:MAG: HD domain-containing protein [Sphingomonadaceae bacterium]